MSHPISNPISKQRRKVLTEEEYTATLTAIVQRDYFPALAELERQAALLERRARGDICGAVAVRRAARRLQQHETALAEEEEADEHEYDHSLDANHHHHQDVGPVRRRARPLHQESISGFHARVTNDDDEEFYSNQKREIQENRERLEILFRPNAAASVPRLMNTSMASDQFEAEPNRIAATEWNHPTVRNGLFFNPTPLRNRRSQDDESIKLITNGSTEPPMSSSQSQLTLMPPPARVMQATKKSTATATSSTLPKHQLVEYVPKHALEKRIEPSQTRFPNHQIIPGRPWLGLAMTTTSESETDGTITDASTDLDAPLRPVDEERRRQKRRKEQIQQSYVAMTPLIVPGATLGNESPITTWGTIDSTPLLLSGREASGEKDASSSYSLAGENHRERAARKAEKELARRAKRAKAAARQSSQTGSTRTVFTTPALTPAALALWQRTSGHIIRTPSRSRDALGASLRSSYTPKLPSKSLPNSISRGLSSSARRPTDNAFNSTPLASRK